MNRTLKIESGSGLVWTIHLVRQGEKHGNNEWVHHGREPLVEIYHVDYFVAIFEKWTLVEHKKSNGLLMGDYKIDGPTMERIATWLLKVDDLELKIKGHEEYIAKSKLELAATKSLDKSRDIAHGIKCAEYQLAVEKLMLEKAVFDADEIDIAIQNVRDSLSDCKKQLVKCDPIILEPNIKALQKHVNETNTD